MTSTSIGFSASGFAVALAASTLLMASPAAADSLTVGVANSEGTGVFADATLFKRYQQVIGAPAFSSLTGPVAISSFTLFPVLTDYWGDPMPAQYQTIATGNYVIRLSTTSWGVDALGSSFSGNLGSDVQTFYSGTLANTVTVTGSTPFIYDPSLGNLLIDVEVLSQTLDSGGFYRAQESLAQFNNPVLRDQISSRTGNGDAAITTGLPFTRSGGYVMQFQFAEPTAAVPEPAMWMMMIAGFGMIGSRLRRGRHAPDRVTA